MTSREHPTATITTPNSTPGQSGRFGSESVAAFVGMRTVLEAVGSGAITPAEGQAVTSLLEAHRRTFEVEELEHRIEALEAQQCAAR